VRIAGNKLTKIAQEKGVDVATLAQAVVEPGKGLGNAEKAQSAVRNWMRGNDHPRCKAAQVKKLAAALSVPVGKIAKFECRFRFERGSPRKTKLLTDLSRGKDYLTAQNLLTFNIKRAAVDVKQALAAAYDDAMAAEADVEKLVVSESAADDGPRMKRFNQKDRGRAHRIYKRMTHITVALAEKD